MSAFSSYRLGKCITKIRDEDFNSKTTDNLGASKSNLLGSWETPGGGDAESLKGVKNAELLKGGKNVDWSSLPPELLENILEKLTVIIDYHRFTAVCKSWLSAISSANRPPRRLPCQIPWLMLPSPDEDIVYDKENVYGGDFFSVSDNKVYHIDLPKARSERCFGSSHGWLCFVEDKTLSIFLLNPLTKARIQLPPITTIPELTRRLSVSETTGQVEVEFRWKCESMGWDYDDYDSKYMFYHFMVKCILSDNPTVNNRYIVVVIYSDEKNVAFCRAGDDKWQVLIKRREWVYDAIFHKGQFYTISVAGKFKVFDADLNYPKVETEVFKDCYTLSNYRYLVEVSGELLMVVRHRSGAGAGASKGVSKCFYKTLWFHVYKFIPKSEEWIRVRSLDDYTVFVGKNHSVSVLAKNMQPKEVCKPNCIYFTVNDTFKMNHVGGHDIGIFNLEDDSIEILPCYPKGKLWIWPPPMWITPSLS